MSAGRQRMRFVGSVLVRNEDVFVEQAVRNVAAFCDRIHAVDHVSQDRTWEILRALADELDHLEVQRSRNAADGHRALESYAGTHTWVLGVDGDELYDPAALARLRAMLFEGEHADVFRLKAHVLNCDGLDRDRQLVSGYMAPPSRPITKLFNFAAVDSWSGCLEPLQGGHAVFRHGYDWETRRDLAAETGWEDDPLRCLHVCFLRRSSEDPETGPSERKNLDESREFRRDVIGFVHRKLRPSGVSARNAALHARGSTWKREWYARGEPVTVDAAPFFGRPRGRDR